MGYKYTSLEDGQIITTNTPRPDLDELARWVRDDVAGTVDEASIVPPSAEPVAGPVNLDPVNGGTPPLHSTGAGIADPASSLTQEQAQEAAAKALAEQTPTADAGSGDGGQGDGENPQRPALNGTSEEWRAYAKHPSVGLDVADDAGRDVVIAAYIEKFAPAGNASGDEWTKYASDHGVSITEGDGRDKIRTATIEAGWAKA